MAFSSSGNIPTAVPDSSWFILTLHHKSLQFFLLLPLGLDRLYLCHYVAEGPTSVPQHPGTPNVHKGESLPPGKNSWEMRFCYMILFYFVVNPWLFGSAQTLRVLPHSRCLMPAWSCLLASLWKSCRSQVVTGKTRHVMRGGASEEANGPRSPTRIPEK